MAAARTKTTRNRLALLGLFALTAMLLLAVGLYFMSSAAPGRGNYRMGVHFPSASGVAPGSQVYLSGVNIGTVSKVVILPDNSVDMILGIRSNTDIPRRSKFSIQSSLTGSPSIAIAPPRAPRTVSGSPTPLPRSEILEKRVMPIAQQPVGSVPASLEDFMRQGQALTNRTKAMFDELGAHRKPLLNALTGARTNGFAVRNDLYGTVAQLQGQMAVTLRKAQANMAEAQTVLRTRDQRKLAMLAASFQETARSAQTVQFSMRAALRSPQAKQNLRDAAARLRVAMSNMQTLSESLEGIASGAQTKAQLRDAGAQLRAVIQKLKSLL
jgi:phospholipid/cholesterol/gamma-HCH transport system substrate-binding protein